MLVGIDSMVLIFAGCVPSKRPVSEDLRIRATLLLHYLAKEKATILLPTVALGEILVPVSNQQQGNLILKLKKWFVLQPFDVRAAGCAAAVWARAKLDSVDDSYENRNVLKADAQIVGTS